jgi:hypothetical protein
MALIKSRGKKSQEVEKYLMEKKGALAYTRIAKNNLVKAQLERSGFIVATL